MLESLPSSFSVSGYFNRTDDDFRNLREEHFIKPIWIMQILTLHLIKNKYFDTENESKTW